MIDDRFRRLSFFKDLNDEEFQEISKVSQHMDLKNQEILFNEGDVASDLYLITEGVIDLFSWDKELKKNLRLGYVRQGETLGEISLVINTGRSATAIASTDCKLIKIPFYVLSGILDREKKMAPLLYEKSVLLINRLKWMNTYVVHSLKKEIQHEKVRNKFGKFFIALISCICFFVFAISILADLVKNVSDSSYVSIPLEMAFVLFVLLITDFSEVPLSELGITTKKWKKALFDGLVITIPVAGSVILLTKWLLMKYVASFATMPFFQPFDLILNPNDKNWLYWIKSNLIYVLVGVPLQEFIVRGSIQGNLEKFFSGKYKVLISIFVSNLVFATLHIFISTTVALLVFVAGVYIGWIYSRTHNLLSACLAHAFIGVFSLSIVGFTNLSVP
ncbi:MAG: cyclic nucleotide-binding domain-containing protein [Chlamydiae bacterium]|nr:cyclic nucleotide-binding domain-containing protein [Chlamydiota bacterium]